MPDINVLMFGSYRAGKTSILASMIDSFENIETSTVNKISLKAIPETEKLLQDKKIELKSKVEENISSSKTEWSTNDWGRKTDARYDYEFIMSVDGSQNKYSINFADIPGEWLVTVEDCKKLEEEIATCQIIIIAIDTPHLMEENGAYCDAFNITSQISRFIKRIKNEQDVARMFLFTPVKCEKYYYEGRMDEVNQRIKKEFETLFEYFQHGRRKDLYTIAITPVLTMGGVVFSDFKRDSNLKVVVNENPSNRMNYLRPLDTYYKLYDKNPKFEPKYCEQPILYLLNFILKNRKFSVQKKEKKSMFWRFAELVCAIIAVPIDILTGDFEHLKELWSELLNDTLLIESAITATEHIKTSGDGYEIVQNPF